MIDRGLLAMSWLRFVSPPQPDEERQAPGGEPALRVACPHCTNVDTLSRHCTNARCRWASCTCGALVYTLRRHRHPRHGSGRDTCHDPRAAV